MMESDIRRLESRNSVLVEGDEVRAQSYSSTTSPSHSTSVAIAA